jgi:hypothetical protein
MVSEGSRYTVALLQLLPAFSPSRQALAAKAKFAFVKAKHKTEGKAP